MRHRVNHQRNRRGCQQCSPLRNHHLLQPRSLLGNLLMYPQYNLPTVQLNSQVHVQVVNLLVFLVASLRSIQLCNLLASLLVCQLDYQQCSLLFRRHRSPQICHLGSHQINLLVFLARNQHYSPLQSLLINLLVSLLVSLQNYPQGSLVIVPVLNRPRIQLINQLALPP